MKNKLVLLLIAFLLMPTFTRAGGLESPPLYVKVANKNGINIQCDSAAKDELKKTVEEECKKYKDNEIDYGICSLNYKIDKNCSSNKYHLNYGEQGVLYLYEEYYLFNKYNIEDYEKDFEPVDKVYKLIEDSYYLSNEYAPYKTNKTAISIYGNDIYAGPNSTIYKTIGKIEEYDSFKVRMIYDGFYDVFGYAYIDYNGKKGWINLPLIRDEKISYILTHDIIAKNVKDKNKTKIIKANTILKDIYINIIDGTHFEYIYSADGYYYNFESNDDVLLLESDQLISLDIKTKMSLYESFPNISYSEDHENNYEKEIKNIKVIDEVSANSTFETKYYFIKESYDKVVLLLFVNYNGKDGWINLYCDKEKVNDYIVYEYLNNDEDDDNDDYNDYYYYYYYDEIDGIKDDDNKENITTNESTKEKELKKETVNEKNNSNNKVYVICGLYLVSFILIIILLILVIKNKKKKKSNENNSL